MVEDRIAAHQTNEISGRYYNLQLSTERFQEFQEIQEAARALFKASKIAKNKVSSNNLPMNKIEDDQNFDRNLNSC